MSRPRPSTPPLLSARNPRVAELGRLSRQRRAREAAGRFVVDGPVLLGEALDAGVEVDAVYAEADALDRPEVAAALAAAEAAGAEVWAVAGGLARHLDVSSPHGLAAVARVPATGEGGGNPTLHVVLVGVTDPGNAGTLLRTAEAVGAGVALTDGSVDPWAPKVVRASAGSVLRVPLRRGPALEVLAALADDGVALVGTRADGGAAPEALDLAGPTALVLGSEAHGLPAEVEAVVGTWATLPMQGRVESLNVAVAGSVLAFEAVRQRSRRDRAASGTMEP